MWTRYYQNCNLYKYTKFDEGRSREKILISKMDVTKKLDLNKALIPEWEKLMVRKSQSMYGFYDSFVDRKRIACNRQLQLRRNWFAHCSILFDYIEIFWCHSKITFKVIPIVKLFSHHHSYFCFLLMYNHFPILLLLLLFLLLHWY